MLKQHFTERNRCVKILTIAIENVYFINKQFLKEQNNGKKLSYS